MWAVELAAGLFQAEVKCKTGETSEAKLISVQ